MKDTHSNELLDGLTIDELSILIDWSERQVISGQGPELSKDLIREVKRQAKERQCSCGCGAAVRPGSRYLRGHHSRRPSASTLARRLETRRENAAMQREIRAEQAGEARQTRP